MSPAASIKSHALALGFNLIGITPAQPSPYLDAYLRWIEAGMHGQMGYMAREDRVSRRHDLNVILPGVKSIILVGLDYAALNIPEKILSDPLRGRISNYAWGVDYHDLMTPRLEVLANWIKDQLGTEKSVQHRVYVDTGAILERSHAQQAGIGFIGKNTMLIHPKRGSFFFLGEILTTLEFEEYDSPHPESLCAGCTRCLNACPTDAFPRPYVLDARRCISYLTIELKGAIPLDMRPLMGNWVYGCDVCQNVCPFVRRFPIETHEPAFHPIDLDRAAPPLRDFLQMTPDGFMKRFGGSAIQRIGFERMIRNACVAAGNAAAPELRPFLEKIAARADDLPLASDHAQWALSQMA